MCKYGLLSFFSYFFFFNLTFFARFLVNTKYFLPSGFNFFPSQCPWLQGAMCHAAVPFLPVSQSLVRSWAPSAIWLVCTSQACILVTPRAGAVHAIASQGTFLRPLLIFHEGFLEAAWHWYVYITSPSLRPESRTTVNFTEVYDWSPTASPVTFGTEPSAGRDLAVR